MLVFSIIINKFEPNFLTISVKGEWGVENVSEILFIFLIQSRVEYDSDVYLEPRLPHISISVQSTNRKL